MTEARRRFRSRASALGDLVVGPRAARRFDFGDAHAMPDIPQASTPESPRLVPHVCKRFASGDLVLVIGAGPAGLTAAIDVLSLGGIPLVVDIEDQVGGLARTIEYRGNRIDLGGHRFFSRCASVMQWWLDVLPLQGAPSRDDVALGRKVPLSDEKGAPDPERDDAVMLSRTRLSRIYFLRRFFDYPVTLSITTVRGLGLLRMARIVASYLHARVRPIRPEKTLEEFFVNRFGRVLYQLFFEDYTRKVWGVPCSEIGSEWGVQRVKGLSIGAAIKHAVTSSSRRDDSVDQTAVPTTLIGRFLYPKCGPGQLWEAVAARVQARGGTIRLQQEVLGLCVDKGTVREVRLKDLASGEEQTVRPDFVLSSMPLADLVLRIEGETPPFEALDVARGLPYRDFITVGLLVAQMSVGDPESGRIPDNWLYMQERDVRVGRLQVFNNWSPYLVADPRQTWLGMEYFCSEGDEISSMDDAELVRVAIDELSLLHLIDADDVLDSVVIRVPKAYPGYFGTYDRIDAVREYVDSIENLYVMGRNGMHRYNNMDHSMLSAQAAVNAMAGQGTREEVWLVNIDDEHHEEPSAAEF